MHPYLEVRVKGLAKAGRHGHSHDARHAVLEQPIDGRGGGKGLWREKHLAFNVTFQKQQMPVHCRTGQACFSLGPSEAPCHPAAPHLAVPPTTGANRAPPVKRVRTLAPARNAWPSMSPLPLRGFRTRPRDPSLPVLRRRMPPRGPGLPIPCPDHDISAPG